MSASFDYPKIAYFGRVLPKNRIYEHARASARLKQLFVDQVDQIIWRYKLAPETINLEGSASVPEIQVFSLTQRVPELHEDVLCAIDNSIRFPIIFELLFEGKRQMAAAFKRPSDADASKWVVSSYFASDWEAEDKSRQPMPQALTLSALYDRLLSTLLPSSNVAGVPLGQRVARAEAISAKRREIERIGERLEREKQFNKRVAINAELRQANAELRTLVGE